MAGAQPMTAERARVDDAASPPAPASPGTRIRACLVVLGGEPFAIDVLCLREVMIVDKLTRVVAEHDAAVRKYGTVRPATPMLPPSPP